MLDVLPWYRSKIIVGALVSIACAILAQTGLVTAITGEQQGGIVDLILLAGTIIGGSTAVGARVTQRWVPSITLGKR